MQQQRWKQLGEGLDFVVDGGVGRVARLRNLDEQEGVVEDEERAIELAFHSIDLGRGTTYKPNDKGFRRYPYRSVRR